jgi:hypothetical protein
VGKGSVAVGYAEVYSSGDDDIDRNSGEEAVIGAANGSCRDIRRCRASFCADSRMYFCMDWFCNKMLIDVRGQFELKTLTLLKVGLAMGAMFEKLSMRLVCIE